MTREVVTGPAHLSVEESKALLHAHRVEKLPLVDEEGNLAGLLTLKDIERSRLSQTLRATPKGASFVGQQLAPVPIWTNEPRL